MLPRGTSYRFRASARLVRAGWALWSRASRRIDGVERRENVLGTYAPLALISLLVYWAVVLILGYGLVFHGLRAQLHPHPAFGDAIYFAGTTFLTIGYGDVTPRGDTARIIALATGANGFALIAILTTFLFSVFGAFTTREVFVVTLGVRGGAPPSGVTLIETYARTGIAANLDGLFEEATRWAATVLETHVAYPILSYFRSAHDNESWVAALGAMLDATTLTMTVLRETPPGHAKICNAMMRHVVHDLTRQFHFSADLEAGVDRSEFDAARDRLRTAGLAVVEEDAAWEKFSAMRAEYAAPLNEMARYWNIPPAQWVGDRSLLSQHASLKTRR